MAAEHPEKSFRDAMAALNRSERQRSFAQAKLDELLPQIREVTRIEAERNAAFAERDRLLAQRKVAELARRFAERGAALPSGYADELPESNELERRLQASERRCSDLEQQLSAARASLASAEQRLRERFQIG
jgi:hypothetical protein